MQRPGKSNVPANANQLRQCTQAGIKQMGEAVASGISYEEERSLCASLVETLIQRYQGALSTYALSLLGMDEAAQDIVQDTWIALYLQIQQRPSWAVQANIFAWLRVVVKNRAINYHKTRQRLSSFDAESATFAYELSLPSFEYPENTAVREDICLALYQAVRKLCKPQRDVIAYRFFYGCSLREIVDELGVPLNTVKARLSRGKKQLLKLLAERGVEGGDLEIWALERQPKVFLDEQVIAHKFVIN